MPISTIPEVLEDLKQGRMVILVDDPNRENEGDLTMLAEHVTPEAINFMAKEGRGLICMPMAFSFTSLHGHFKFKCSPDTDIVVVELGVLCWLCIETL